MKRSPYKLRADTPVCGRCGTKHKKNQCPKRIPRDLLQKLYKQPTRGQLHDAHFRESAASKALKEYVQREVRIAERDRKRCAHVQKQIDKMKQAETVIQEEGPEQWEAELAALQTDADCDE